MSDFENWEKVAFRCIAGVAFVLFLYSVHMLTKRISVALCVLAFVNISIAYVNVLYSVQRYIASSSTAAYAADALQACIVPGCTLVAYELIYYLHLRRRAKFMCISFDQGNLHSTRAFFALWTVRLITLGMIVIGILVNFELVGEEDDHDDDDTEGHVGFLSVDDHSQILHAIGIVPIVFMLFIAILVTLETLQYGSNAALSVTGAGTWAVIAIGTAALIAGEFFLENWYMVTSNMGRVIFALSLLVVGHTANRDIEEMNTFDDFLAKSRSSAFASSTHSAPGHADAHRGDDSSTDSEAGAGVVVVRASQQPVARFDGQEDSGDEKEEMQVARAQQDVEL